MKIPFVQKFRVTPAFSLIEILVVLALFLILTTLVFPAFNSIAVGSNLNRSGQLVADQIALARLTAVTRNREVQLRIFNLADGSSNHWRGIQIYRVEQTPSGPMDIPQGRLKVFPEGISFEEADSPLIASDAKISGAAEIPQYGNVDYRGFRFRANGSADIGTDATKNYITIRQASSPHNYYTVQVNPVTGKAEIFRP